MFRLLLIAALLVPTAAFADEKTTELSKWGLGLGIGLEHFRSPYIEEATTHGDSRIVSVDKQYETNPSAWLSLHWNIGRIRDPKSETHNVAGILEVVQTNSIDWGLFAAVKVFGTGDNQAFSGFGLGPQITFKTGKGTSTRNISLGLGVMSHKTRGLAHGIEEGKPLPIDYKDVRYRERSETSIMIMLTVGLLEN